MNTERASLEAVLEEFVASAAKPSVAALREWIARYPEYEQELTEFTVSWSCANVLPPSEAVQEDDGTETLVLRGMSVVENLLFSARQKSNEQQSKSLSGILDEAKSVGTAPAKLAAHLRVSVALLRKIDRHLIIPDTIPLQLLEGVADFFGRTTAAIQHSLKRTPVIAANARHHSKTKPVVAKQQDFFEAVRQDDSLDQHLREYWLSLSPDHHR